MSTFNKKPYRVYRQRRRRGSGDGSIQWDSVRTADDPSQYKKTGFLRAVLRLLRRILFVAAAAAAVWVGIAYFSFHNSVKQRNQALPKDVRLALTPANGPAISADHVTMLVGSDTSQHRQKVGEVSLEGALADTLILMRVNVPTRTVSMLSIPRDLYVDIPGHRRNKINAAYAIGGLPLSIKTVRRVTGIDVHHVAQIDFDGFKNIVDTLGGITFFNPYHVESGKETFDGRHWVFPRGRLTLNGRDALAYARIRKVNARTIRSNNAESSELGRARRQQRVIDTIISEVVDIDSLRHPKKVPHAIVQPLLTDLTASELTTFAFAKWWSRPKNNLRCRLGGEAESNADGDVLIPVEENRAVIRMWQGQQAPLAPANSIAPGCVREAPKR